MTNLIIDIKTKHSILTDVCNGISLMDSIVRHNGYTVMKCESVEFPNKAYSAFIILAESHINIHTWVENDYISLEIFACKGIDINGTIELIKRYIHCDDIKYTEVKRGFN